MKLLLVLPTVVAILAFLRFSMGKHRNTPLNDIKRLLLMAFILFWGSILQIISDGNWDVACIFFAFSMVFIGLAKFRHYLLQRDQKLKEKQLAEWEAYEAENAEQNSL